MGGEGPFDLAVVGAGIVGLGCALAAARRGKRVVVIDRDAQANGASVRNFGFVTVTGQAPGAMWARARRSRDLWLEIAAEANIPIWQRGLALAVRRTESLAVLRAFMDSETAGDCVLLDDAELRRRLPPFMGPDILAALWSPGDVRVDSPSAIPALAAWLAERHNVVFLRRTAALAVDTSVVTTSRGVVKTEAIAVCPGDDLATLFPECFAAHDVTRCKLQMMRLADPGFRLPCAVMSDLGLIRYAGYASLPPADGLRARLEREQPDHVREGVHLIVVQGADGELIVGDSHDYAATPDPFGRAAIDGLILEEYAAVFGRAAPAVRESWTGTYAAAPDQPVLIAEPAPGVRLAVVTTGAGASIGFALGEEVVGELFGSAS